MSNPGSTVVYHEKQVASLCGVHCLNTLLQGSYFTEIDLAHVAQELDKQEREMMSENGFETKDFLKFVAEDSGNVADDGNYSIQVLEKALSSFGLTCNNINKKEFSEVIKNPLNEEAFICNLSAHWFTLRKVNGNWFNLNSLLKTPEFLSNFYISLFLETLRTDGWTVFVVRGSFPQIIPYSPAELGKWLEISNQPKTTSVQVGRTNNNSGGGGDWGEDEELKKAIQESLDYHDNLQDFQSIQNFDRSRGVNHFNNISFENPFNYVPPNEYEDDDEELKRAIAESLNQS
ncbi:hypothetical protein CYY_006654 [Polysphondylium violaceum]|uniref:ubiquitinyl hydrolase 1 n=1 Tax=Polysphondylium violaceum TaxID=133409 RepID=A0A8J4PS66_9MYCE|nr:hypothetical protein CYY_006654 [Polysphondylium violaceum]